MARLLVIRRCAMPICPAKYLYGQPIIANPASLPRRARDVRQIGIGANDLKDGLGGLHGLRNQERQRYLHGCVIDACLIKNLGCAN